MAKVVKRRRQREQQPDKWKMAGCRTSTDRRQGHGQDDGKTAAKAATARWCDGKRAAMWSGIGDRPPGRDARSARTPGKPTCSAGISIFT